MIDRLEHVRVTKRRTKPQDPLRRDTLSCSGIFISLATCWALYQQ